MIQEVKITKKEQQVLELISLEYTSDEITQEMFISTHTAHTHRKNLLSKLEAKNTAGLVRKAFECRLLQLSYILIILLLNTCIQAQDPLVDIEGDSRVRGILDINHDEDTTSIYIGRATGLNLLGPVVGQNTIVGSRAGFFNSKRRNSIFGYEAGYENDGEENLFVGVRAGYHNLADYNTFLGYYSGYDNTNGYENTFVGYDSGSGNLGGEKIRFMAVVLETII